MGPSMPPAKSFNPQVFPAQASYYYQPAPAAVYAGQYVSPFQFANYSRPVYYYPDVTYYYYYYGR